MRGSIVPLVETVTGRYPDISLRQSAARRVDTELLANETSDLFAQFVRSLRIIAVRYTSSTVKWN